MTATEINLLWTILSIIVSVLGSVAFAAWWLKGQLTGAEVAGLREQNAALTAWRGFAEAKVEELVARLAEARATNTTLEKQIAEGAKKEVLATTAAYVSRTVERVDDDLRKWLSERIVIGPHKEPWKTFELPPTKPKPGGPPDITAPSF